MHKTDNQTTPFVVKVVKVILVKINFGNAVILLTII